MKIVAIHQMRTCYPDGGKGGVHESIFRSYHILEKTKELLAQGVPAPVVLDLIAYMESPE